MLSFDAARLAAEAAESLKGERITLLETGDITTVCDYFVICSASSTVRVRAIADRIEERLRTEIGLLPKHREGYDAARWILLDYGDVVVHVFLDEARDFYNLERLWGDAKALELEALG